MLVRNVLKRWFPNKLNVVIFLFLLPFWILVAVGFVSMLVHDIKYSQNRHRVTTGAKSDVRNRN